MKNLDRKVGWDGLVDLYSRLNPENQDIIIRELLSPRFDSKRWDPLNESIGIRLRKKLNAFEMAAERKYPIPTYIMPTNGQLLEAGIKKHKFDKLLLNMNRVSQWQPRLVSTSTDAAIKRYQEIIEHSEYLRHCAAVASSNNAQRAAEVKAQKIERNVDTRMGWLKLDSMAANYQAQRSSQRAVSRARASFSSTYQQPSTQAWAASAATVASPGSSTKSSANSAVTNVSWTTQPRVQQENKAIKAFVERKAEVKAEIIKNPVVIPQSTTTVQIQGGKNYISEINRPAQYEQQQNFSYTKK